MAAAPQETHSEAMGYRGDPLFKGCTRPAMIFGVPVVPLVVVAGIIIILAVWTTILVAVLIPVAILIMRQIVKKDDQQFRLLGLRMRFRLVAMNRNARFWKASAYSPVGFKKRR